jgi:asparagine synthase (glutamine-hydrolysing)
MCGIAGIVARASAGRVSQRDLLSLRDAQRHRGPDDEGHWISEDGRVGLGHRRLSIIDLSADGRQPMHDPEGRCRIVFNGEIYNYRALRRELEAAGCRFVTASDTEAILVGYRFWGAEVLNRLRGMFAFAIHDAATGELFLARDPMGIKPLYYSLERERFCFASEVQALRAIGAAEGTDPDALIAFLLWGSIPAPATLHANVRALEPGHWLRLRPDGEPESGAYASLDDAFGHPVSMDAVEARERIGAALRDSVRHHLVADVPVGAFLSGGVDSSALLGLLTEAHDGPVETVTLAFDVPELDEGALAAQASRVYGSDHHEIRLGIDDVRDAMSEAVGSLDQPTVDGVNTYFVSRATAEAGLKVAVSGVGGDELFGGYLGFRRMPAILRAHTAADRLPGLCGALHWAASRLEETALPRIPARLARAALHGASPGGAYYADRGLFSPPDVRAMLVPELRERVDAWMPAPWLAARVPTDGLDAGDWVSLLEHRQYLQNQLLRDTDATSMAHALEVRTPLVDYTLLRAVAEVPVRHRHAGPAKAMLREAPVPPVPDALWNRRKQGFTLPIDHWIRSGALDLPLPDHACLDRDAVERVAKRFEQGALHHSRLWALLVLARFLD